MAQTRTIKEYGVSRRDKEPLLEFMLEALRGAGCTVIYSSPPDKAPFRITFETALGERMGIVAYAFLANSRLTKNRPDDEHRFQLKYGSKDGRLHHLWQDPYGLYTTLLVGINPEQGFFVAADPVLHSPTKLFISIEFKQNHADAILKEGWFAWERVRRSSSHEPVEVLVGGTAAQFLRLVRFERETLGEDQGHRQLLAEQFGRGDYPAVLLPADRDRIVEPSKVHALSREFELTESEVLDLIGHAPRLKMAVRGWVAEEHLVRVLRQVEGVSHCERLNVEGGADVELRYRNSRPIVVECKNVLRTTLADGTPRVDFQRTRASKSDPCSRYYSPDDFDVVAACLHAVTERWEFRFVRPPDLDKHKKCKRKLSNNVRIDDRWRQDPSPILGSFL